MIVEQADGTLAREYKHPCCSTNNEVGVLTYKWTPFTAFDPGDIAWMLTCSALVWLMMCVPHLRYVSDRHR
jgi:hypothetical protein